MELFRSNFLSNASKSETSFLEIEHSEFGHFLIRKTFLKRENRS